MSMISTSIPKCLEYSSLGKPQKGSTFYPQPSKITSIASITTETPSLTMQTKESQNIMREFPSVLDSRIKTIDGEKFHITLAENAKPFCVNTPRAIPYAYRDKLKAELELLQSQGIITPVTVPTEWCAPIVVTPQRDTDAIRMTYLT